MRQIRLPWSGQAPGQGPVIGHIRKKTDTGEKQLQSDNVVLITEARLWQS